MRVALRLRWHALVATGRTITRADRLLLAAKAAVAAAVAWYFAPYVPFADNDYSYYAPLGVLVSMYPTLAGSARAGMQSLAGLGLGITLGLGGLGLVLLGSPAVVAIGLVIAVGILLGGIAVLGVGSEWVAIAGLFVLLLGGTTADEFSLSYLLTMAFGIVVGVATSLLVFPPLHLRRASERLTALRDAIGAGLEGIAEALNAPSFRAEDIDKAIGGLAPMRDGVAREVGEAQESSRGNPRVRAFRNDRDLIMRRMRALEITTLAARDLGDVLNQAAREDAIADPMVRHSLVDTIRACENLVVAPTGEVETEKKIVDAAEALDRSVVQLSRHPNPTGTADYSLAYAYGAIVCVRRIVDACRDFAVATAESASERRSGE